MRMSISLTILAGLSATCLMSGPTFAQQGGGGSFAGRLTEASAILGDMGLKPASVQSNHYHVLYVGRKEFADERKVVLEATRRNFLGFMRRMELEVSEQHEKLLVIVVDTEAQMQEFYRRAAGDGSTLPGWVAGYYSPEHNWSAFYNQRKGGDLAATEARLNDLVAQINQLPGSNTAVIEVETADGVVRKSKAALFAEVEREWTRIVKQVNSFNTTVTQHEGAHQIAFNVGVQDRQAAYPFWVSEGLACVFEVPPSKKGDNRMGAARVNSTRLEDFRGVRQAGKARGLLKLLAMDRRDPVADIGALYAESWATFAFFFHRYPKELSAYMSALAARRSLGGSAPAADEVIEFNKHFMKSIGVLQKEFDAYVEQLKP